MLGSAGGLQRITYGQAIRRFSTNAKLYLAYSSMSGINSSIFLVAFAYYLEEVFSQGASILGTHMGTLAFIGLVLSAQALAHGLNSIPSGLIGDKYGRKKSFISASSLAVVAGVLVLTTADSLFLLLLSILAGLGESFHGVVGAPFMMENSREEERIHLFTMDGVLSTVSAIIGALVAGVLPSFFQQSGLATALSSIEPIGFGSEGSRALRLTLLMSAPFGLIRLVPIAFMKESHGRFQVSLRDVIRLRHVRNRATVAKLFTISATYAAGFGLYFPLLNLHFEHSYHIHTQEFGRIVALNSLGIALGVLALPLLVIRLGKVRTIVLTRLLAIPFILALSVAPTLLLATILFVARGVMASMAFPASSSLSMELVDEQERATTAGITHMSFDVFYGGLIFAGGLFLSAGGFWVAFFLAGAMYVGHALLWWRFFHGHPLDMPFRRLTVR